MIYPIPNIVELNDIFEFYSELNSIIPDGEIILDFSKMHKFDPLPMLMLGSIIKEYLLKHQDTPFSVTWNDEIGKSYAGTMGFFKYISEELELGKMPGEANGSENYIPITPIEFSKLQKIEIDGGNHIFLGDLIEKEAEKLSRVVDRGNIELHKLLTYLIREIMRNTPEHANTDKLWICGQYWSKYNLAEIAILDEGIGVFESITKNIIHRKYIRDNLSALEWSLKAGISNAFNPSNKQKDNDVWANSGFGLFMVSEICKYLNGNFCLISYDNYILKDNQEVKKGSIFLKGTAIRIKVPCENIEDAGKIIRTISSRGEEEARTIRNAFKKASTPSKGLISKIGIDTTVE